MSRKLVEDATWYVASVGKWRHPEEGVEVNEARASFYIAKDASLVRENYETCMLLLLDNQTSTFTFNRGRGQSFALLKLCRRFIGLRIQARIRFR